jgi:hypothetical protein
VAAEGKGHGVEHLHALRHDVVEGDVVGKAAEAEIFAGQPEVVGDAVGDGLRGECVDQVPHAVSAKDDPPGGGNAHRFGRGGRAAKEPRRENGGAAEGEERAPVGQMQEDEEEDEDALCGGAEGE